MKNHDYTDEDITALLGAAYEHVDAPRTNLSRLLNMLPEPSSPAQAPRHVHMQWILRIAVPAFALILVVVGVGFGRSFSPFSTTPSSAVVATDQTAESISDDSLDQDLSAIDVQLDGLSSDESSADQVLEYQ